MLEKNEILYLALVFSISRRCCNLGSEDGEKEVTVERAEQLVPVYQRPASARSFSAYIRSCLISRFSISKFSWRFRDNLFVNEYEKQTHRLAVPALLNTIIEYCTQTSGYIDEQNKVIWFEQVERRFVENETKK